MNQKQNNKTSIDTGSEFEKALQYHKSGQLHKAEEIYKRVLEVNPNHSDSLNLLGAIALQLNKTDAAVDFINKAIQHNPENPVYHNNLGNALKSLGKLNEAVASYQKALELKPDYTEAYNNMGNAFRNQGELNKAISCFQKALKIRPNYAKAYNNMGRSFQDQGKPDEAISCFQKALEINPNLAEVYNNMGNVFKDQGKLVEAISSYQKALEIKPDLADVYYNLGNAFRDQDKLKDAISYYQKALESKPDFAEAYNNMGAVFKDQGKLTDAISCFEKALKTKPEFAKAYNNMGAVIKDQGELTKAISCFKKAVEIQPDYAEAYSNMGALFKDQGELNEAVICLNKALEIKPNLAEAHNNMGCAFQDQEKPDKAISCFQKALEIKPDLAEAYGELFHQLQKTCAWYKLEGMEAKLDEFTAKALAKGTKSPESPLTSLARQTGPSHNFDITRSWSHVIDRAMSTLKVHFPFDDRRSDKARKIIVGYLSNDFRNHAMAHLTLSLYGLHNRNEFEIFCYSYGEDDGSYYRTRIQQDCDKFVDIRDLSHINAARRIYQDRVDILIDFKGHTRSNRLEVLALRPAPIQVRFLGLPCTTGAEFFDYIITDRIAMPEDHAQYYSENFAYLPNCYLINDHTQRVSNKEWKKADFGLPEDSFVFCSFNQGYKIGPVMFNTWMNILKQVPESVLWLQWENEIIENNLKHEAESRGVKTARLIFSKKLPKDQHLGRLRLADVALDTRIVNGIITTSDALWANVPVITLQGSNFASRISSSILSAIGLLELITETLEEYESLAVDMARKPDKLQMIKQKIANNREAKPLFDTPRFTRNLERAYKEMWEIFAAGKIPRQIEVTKNQI